MNVLLVADPKSEIHQAARPILQDKLNAKVHVSPIIQDGIETLEKQDPVFDLIICDYPGTGMALLKCLLMLASDTPVVLCASIAHLDEGLKKAGRIVGSVDRSAADHALKL